ncbi:MAG: type II toxin-antitoxin system MqsA family antitoxin [Actinomycetota bacterium]
MKAPRSFPPTQRRKHPSQCSQCAGSVRSRRVTLVYPGPDSTTRVVHGVPAGVCTSCGEKYITPEVAERIERLLSAPPARSEKVPVWDFAANF